MTTKREALEHYCGIRDDTRDNYGRVLALMDAYGDERELACLDEILDGEYTLEQVADMKRNVEEGIPNAPRRSE